MRALLEVLAISEPSKGWPGAFFLGRTMGARTRKPRLRHWWSDKEAERRAALARARLRARARSLLCFVARKAGEEMRHRRSTRARRTWISAALLLAACSRQPDRERGEHRAASRDEGRAPADEVAEGCSQVPSAQELERYLKVVPNQQEAGGFASGKAEWAALVNRGGTLCALAVSTPEAAEAWPGSQAIAKAKAFTANAFSTDAVPMSTARLYTLSQPGHSLAGIGAGNPFHPECLSTPQQKRGIGKVCGGSIAFGGGLPLYEGGRRVGGLGVSGDTACVDHEIAKRLRSALHLDPPKGPRADDIQYRGVDPPSMFSHPLCLNTWRDGKKLGDETLLPGE